MKTLLLILMACLLSYTAAAQIDLVVLPASESTQVTIYNSVDLTLVRDTRRLTLKRGVNVLQFGWSNTLIDPTSVSIRPLQKAGQIDVQFLSFPPRLQHVGQWQIVSEVEGAVPFEISYFASGLSWRAFYMGTMNEDETMMDLKGYVNVANGSGQDFENAQTRLIVGETRLLEQIAFLAGQPNPYGPYMYDDVTKYNRRGSKKEEELESREKLGLARGARVTNGFGIDLDGGGVGGDRIDMLWSIKAVEKKGLSEYFLYTIEGTEDLTNRWSKRLPSFDVEGIPVKSLYKYDEDRYDSRTVRFVSFENDAEHELGETPIPKGNIKIYRNLNEAQNLSYIGSADIKYIPVNEEAELNLGPDRLVTVEPILMDTKTDNYTFDRKGNITGSDEIQTWKLKLTNTRKIPIELEITRNFGTDYWDLELNNHPGLTATPPSKGGELLNSSRPANAQQFSPCQGGVPRSGEGVEGGRGSNFTYKKHDKNRARFTITLPARSEKSYAYTVTRYHGTRREYYVKKQKTITIERRLNHENKNFFNLFVTIGRRSAGCTGADQAGRPAGTERHHHPAGQSQRDAH